MAVSTTYTFYWKNGKKTTGIGHNERSAFVQSGYPAAHRKLVSFAEEGDSDSHTWFPEMRMWLAKHLEFPDSVLASTA